MDIDALLSPRSADQPSGENLEYDEVFINLEIAAQPSDEIDYPAIVEAAKSVLEKSHDLRAAVYLANAELRTSGLPGFADALTYMDRCLSEHWATCHPELEDDDPTMRANAVVGLADNDGVLASLRHAPLTQSPSFGGFSLRDIMIAEGELQAPEDMESIPDATTIGAAFKETDDGVLAGFLENAQTVEAALKSMDASFEANVPGQAPDLDPVLRIVSRILKRLAAEAGSADAGADADAAPVAAAPVAAAPAPSGGGGGGAIANPNDVINTLDRIIAYYERSEPSSPVPILLHRAKRLVNADFLTIVKDMAPSGLENVNIVGGLEGEEESY